MVTNRDRPAPEPRRHPARRTLSRRAVAAVAVTCGVAAGVVGTMVINAAVNSGSPEPEPVKAVALEQVTTGTMSGQAWMNQNQDGQMTLAVEVSELPQDGYLEVWLRNSDATQMVSLVVLDSKSGSMQVPTGIDLNRYSVVDVSLEHLDGDPTHGGETLMEGDMSSS